MYRILMAVSGCYYVQKQFGWRWIKVGGFFNTRTGARSFIRDHRNNLRVVEYV